MAEATRKLDPFEDAARERADLATPGYWENLAENAATWANEVTVGPFWKRLTKELDRWRSEYREQTGAALLDRPGLPDFTGKSVVGIKDKFARRWTSERREAMFRDGAPPIPQLGDLVRTRIICPYIDGVEYLAGKIEAIADEMGIFKARQRQGSLQGYFAQHIGVTQSVFYRLAGRPTAAEIDCEIQIATTLATRMWDAGHPVYEVERQAAAQSTEWQWNPADPRFLSNQLGHMLHLADGLLIQLREALRKR